MSSQKPTRVLITGASIAGPITGYFLASAKSHPYTVTVLERSPDLRLNGAGVDIRGAGVKVMRAMGLEDAIKDKCTHEAGAHFIGGSGEVVGSFPTGDGDLFSSDIEISRGEVARLCVSRAEAAGVRFVYGDTVGAVSEDARTGIVSVTFTNSGETHDFDLLIIADGLFSKTRDIVFGAQVREQGWVSYNVFVTYFRIPREAADDAWARWYNTHGRRCVFLRPDLDPKKTQATLAILSPDAAFKDLMRKDAAEQKRVFAARFADAGWQARRIIEGMHTADDFYMQEIAQLKLGEWTRGRVALVGDAAYCPSGITGMGTSCATVGAYVLAGELAKSPHDVPGAFRRYEALLRPYVERAQQLPPGAPWIVNPETWWGVAVLRVVLRVVSNSVVLGVFRRLAVAKSWWSPPSDNIVLPEYVF